MIRVTPIGVVKNGIHSRPEMWIDKVSEIHVDTAVQEGLDGLEEFSHVVVVFYLHLVERVLFKVHPRNDQTLPLTGVFSTRAPVRPNPIGVSVVELLKIRENVVTVKGLDAFDGTPVLDIKPHLPVVSPERVAGWV